jgi:uncharacterized damage-inducible protein DinB
MSRLELALGQLKRVRKYTLRLLENTDQADWYRQPSQGITHIAWQAGHLAMAEYRLALQRVRGDHAEDKALISDEFISHFRRESVPEPDPLKNPSPAHIMAVLERVHLQAISELSRLPDEELDTPATSPHPLFDTKLGALLWCAQHEMLHAGQIGLLRRLLGQSPLW